MTGVQTCALPISGERSVGPPAQRIIGFTRIERRVIEAFGKQVGRALTRATPRKVLVPHALGFVKCELVNRLIANHQRMDRDFRHPAIGVLPWSAEHQQQAFPLRQGVRNFFQAGTIHVDTGTSKSHASTQI